MNMPISGFGEQAFTDASRLGPVNTTEGCASVPARAQSEAGDAAQAGRLGEESNDALRPGRLAPFGLVPERP